MNYYKTILQNLGKVSPDFDWQQAFYDIAATNPQAVCEAMGWESLEVRTMRVFKAQGMVPAIKFLRENTEPRLGIGEAREQIIEWNKNGT